MSVLDDMAAHLMGLARPGAQGSPTGVAVESPTTPAQQRRFSDDGPVGMFEVDFSGTLYEGINYVRGPGSTNKFGTVPPMARHGMVFAGLLDPHVPGYVLIIRESSGLYDGLYVPCAYEGRRCVRRVADGSPLVPSRPRTPPEQGELSSDVKGAWDRYFAENDVVREAWAAADDDTASTSSSSCSERGE